jgi:hypothetical protein
LSAEQLRDPDRKRLLLIDEPGTYLHARAQKDVLHLLEERQSKKDQVIYSTHSPFLIPNADTLHRLRVVVKTPEKGTVVLDRLTHPMLRGPEFSDTLSPILSAIGLDIRQAAAFIRDRNLIVEGISDYFYVSAWARLTNPQFLEKVHVFPATGALSEVTLASLFIGWGIDFVAFLDREGNGNAARDKLIRELGIPENRVIQPDQALGVEDLFTEADFGSLLASLDPSLKINNGETPTKAVKRQRVDKVLLAREVLGRPVKRCGQSLGRDSEASHCAAYANLGSISSEIAIRRDEHTPSTGRAADVPICLGLRIAPHLSYRMRRTRFLNVESWRTRRALRNYSCYQIRVIFYGDG